MKLKKLSKVLAAGGLTIAMCAATMMPAFAAQTPNAEDAIVSDSQTDVTAAITKVLKTGLTTTTPAVTFTYKFTQVRSAGASDTDTSTFQLQDAATYTTTPTATTAQVEVMNRQVGINPVSITLDNTMEGKQETDGTTRAKVVEKESGNFLANLTFPSAGIYVYDVEENKSTGAYTLTTKDNKESMVYSQAKYRIYLYVANKTDGTNGTYIKAIGDVLTATQTGTTTPGQDGVGSKVDPTPGVSTVGYVDGAHSQMKFQNDYLQNPGNGSKKPDKTSLEFSKKVAGDYGDKNKYFDFSITLKNPDVLKDATSKITSYIGYIVDENGTIVTTDTDKNYAKTYTNDGGIEFTLNATTGVSESQTISLKHGQYLVFPYAPTGTYFQAVETGAKNYTPSAKILVNDISTDAPTVAEGANLDTAEKIVGQNAKNGADFTNKYKDITPTGIIINNLPFVMMIIFAAVVFVAVIAFGVRRKNHQN